MDALLAPATPQALRDADLERRFGGLRRLWGPARYARVRAARFAVVGLGGVGSWAAEALARCGVAEIVLIDLDHVAESNVNRQVHALSATLGASKVQAMSQRIAEIHPGCATPGIEEFVGADSWPALMPQQVDVLIDACDDPVAKLALAAWALRERQPLVVVGAAGGKQQPQAVRVGDLATATHDPLLAGLRRRLRREHGAPAQGAIGIRCVWSAEPVAAPWAEAADCAIDARGDGSLNCHGYGSAVTVTATFGFVAAAQALEALD